MDNNEMFGKLFDITNRNMVDSGGKLEYSREAFLFCTQCTPGKADFLEMNGFDNPTFLQAAYIALFFRTVDEGALKNWLGRSNMWNTDFQKALMGALTRSQEFLDKGVAVENYFYSQRCEANRSLAPVVVTVGGQNSSGINHPAVNKAYRFYKKLPKPIKSLIRKIMGIK